MPRGNEVKRTIRDGRSMPDVVAQAIEARKKKRDAESADDQPVSDDRETVEFGDDGPMVRRRSSAETTPLVSTDTSQGLPAISEGAGRATTQLTPPAQPEDAADAAIAEELKTCWTPHGSNHNLAGCADAVAKLSSAEFDLTDEVNGLSKMIDEEGVPTSHIGVDMPPGELSLQDSFGRSQSGDLKPSEVFRRR